MQTKKLPVAINNFAKLRSEGLYYADKTLLIRDLLEHSSYVSLLSRPHNFGKTLNLTMLQSFFEIKDTNLLKANAENKDVGQLNTVSEPSAYSDYSKSSKCEFSKPSETREAASGGIAENLFEGLAISAEKELCAKHQGQYPVIYLSLTDVDGTTFEEAYDKLRSVIRAEALRFPFLLTSDKLHEYYKKDLQKIYDDTLDQAGVKCSLERLTSLLAIHYGRNTIVLIDDFDVPLANAYQHGYYEKMSDLITGLFLAALKSNRFLSFGVLTGSLNIVSLCSVFGGLDNISSYPLTHHWLTEYYGFTEQEVRQILDHYGLQEHFQDITDWYGGYYVGEQYLYCPRDVINRCSALTAAGAEKPAADWSPVKKVPGFRESVSQADPQGAAMIRSLLDDASTGAMSMHIEHLLNGQPIYERLNMQLTHNQLDSDRDNIWTLLFLAGYLTETDSKQPRDDYFHTSKLVIPNRKVQQLFKEQVLNALTDKGDTEVNRYPELYTALATGDTEVIAEILSKELQQTVRYFDDANTFQRAFISALLYTCPDWQVMINAASGQGLCDIIVHQKDDKLCLFFEIRQSEDNTAAESEKIIHNEFAAALKKSIRPVTWVYSITFCRIKECLVTARKLSL